ncbi:MAG: bifunctional UDP-N-acetylglucosamine diphosphorylase/glucosamine-1-phosphate N-acetyltransferase GlmU [Candidatus Eremiobacteraeota bacterium]|nr:bifunctional UDP-N-acetylglucosamine diphosphorylase/glucosamine-1-phosphate N-acetyltransferase GlmU [Candidatus Eremiobacteraeota bacterium]
MSERTSAFILAAGKGTRMKSRRPKVLYELCGRTMFEHVLLAVTKAGVESENIIVVTNPDLEEPLEQFDVRVAVQEPQNGTGHAAQIAMKELTGDGQVLIVNADMPLLPSELLRAVIELRERTRASLSVLTTNMPASTTFGRIVRKGGRPVRIVEHSDATPRELLITEVNAGVYCFAVPALRGYLKQLHAGNAQKELYLTDCVEAAVESGDLVEAAVSKDARSVLGVNTQAELAAARRVMRARILRAHMSAGVNIVDPNSTYVDVDVDLAPDVLLLPQTHVLKGSAVGQGSRIGPNTILDKATVGEGATISCSVVRDSTIAAGAIVGPFAHIRGGSQIESDARIGNFVEVKNTKIGRKAKASHLAYVGDAEVGDDANIGAGTITCNFDGTRKHKTKIGAHASIGSNTSLVAPVEIGEGALTGAGSVVTHDVPAGQRVAGNPARPMQKKEQAKRP